MAYTSMKKLIQNENQKFDKGIVSPQEYNLWKENTINKLDVFLACNRITSAQYEELNDMLY